MLMAFPGLWPRIGDWSADDSALMLKTWDWVYHLNVTDNSLSRLPAASGPRPLFSNAVQLWSPDSSTLVLLMPNDSYQSALSLWRPGEETLQPIFSTGVLAAAWSPDSQKFAVWGAGDCQANFDAVQGYLNQCSLDLYTINADGQSLARLTSLKIDDSHQLETIQWIHR